MKISVIVPVYNAEKFLNKCIESVVQQMYMDWELLLVDDGSSDKSAEIMKAACEKDSRIREFHQKNAGPGIARNRGIESATGDYIVFLDADDYIDPEYFALLAQNEGKDVIFIDIDQVTGDGKLLKREAMSVYKDWNIDKILRSQMTGKIPWGGVRKAVKREILTQKHIVYAAYTIGEEALYSFRILKAAKTVGFIEKPVYFYVNHENSQSKAVMDDPWGPVVEGMREYLQENGLYEEYADTLNAFNLTATVVSLDRIQQMYGGKERKNAAQERMKRFWSLHDKTKKVDYDDTDTRVRVLAPFVFHGHYQLVLWISAVKQLGKK
ncbi:MAG: glycosyltransferase family 2 protein [Lachnospiraceae bacterium]|nr:glycosyltransferase family 2 protein [Lachnospiraceae bacterium]